MTTRERLEKYLQDNGMFLDQAKSVMDLACSEIDNIVPGYTITWDQPAENYPDKMYSLWIHKLQPIALKWIDENAPEAWFRDMFKE